MQGSSRGAAAAARKALAETLQQPGVDWSVLAEELFAVTGALDSSAALRRALADPSREPQVKRDLAARLFGGKVGEATGNLVGVAVSGRWSSERDLSDTTEELAVETVMAMAEAGGRLDSVEDELFRFGRVVAGNPGLRDALTDRHAGRTAKAQLVSSLLEGKASDETVRLARQAVLAPRGRRFDRVLESYLAIAARRREQLTATIISAAPLDDAQRDRLTAALSSMYEKQVLANVIVDPEVLGGLRIQIGDEVVDGTIARRLDEAKRKLIG
ncbi:F0F1 ATP synthase subunit delta [Segeticoccus rhizosphaerae]|jgi:F-type H+-transporting ATPase subunit delta|uniref:F0F1 ATP synthase subunit delta n=1 Tax=Segeticoccus rhizosphaerae TaxID=1104777 RepID=UPI0010C05074|nr:MULTISPECIES: F0F1 ATP synthase subunit delta [Intrasporangiaceae]